MILIIEARHQRLILTSGRLIRDRRHQRPWHFINERRGRTDLTRKLYQGIFAFILMTVTVATWLIAFNARPDIGYRIIFAYNLVLFGILLIKPYRRMVNLALS
jgi:hypothetical protein